jgi:hypothetical protein
MIQIFYKDKPIIISDKKSDLKDTLLIDLKIIKSVDILKLLRKKKVFSIGIKSKSPEKVISKFSKLFLKLLRLEVKFITINLKFYLFTEIKNGIYQKVRPKKMKIFLRLQLEKFLRKQVF